MWSYEEKLVFVGRRNTATSGRQGFKRLSITLFREDQVAFRILCCRVAERLLHFSFSIMFYLKRFQKNYLERTFLKYISSVCDFLTMLLVLYGYHQSSCHELQWNSPLAACSHAGTSFHNVHNVFCQCLILDYICFFPHSAVNLL